jgi:ssDNA-binding Zn-finger/Zn-ribbon topoisomerase 1
MYNRFRGYLKCPGCGRAAVAGLSKFDGCTYRPDDSTMVDYLPKGFKVANQKSCVGDIDLVCEKCGVSAITKDNQPE